KSAPGALARLAALEVVFGRLPIGAPPAAALDDALDAAACAWSAGRWLRGEALQLGDGTRDRLGRPMRVIV
ncbi:MAG: hypothetical protein JWL64_1334, partial [Frankiales bacterium]|nr:hypothetical protein [Frankiales bacterium]